MPTFFADSLVRRGTGTPWSAKEPSPPDRTLESGDTDYSPSLAEATSDIAVETNWSGISYSAGSWGYGAGTERALAEDFDGYFYADAFDLANTAIRLCANPSNSGLAHCAE